jgi:ABC-type glycerol-3-phosphate transport system substrate-binding protein
MADWFKKGYIYKEAFQINSREKELELVKQNRVGAAAIWYTSVLNTNTIKPLREIDPDAEYIVVNLQGPKGNTVTSGSVGGTGTMISKKSQNPAAAMQYLNWIQSDLHNYLTIQHGIEGVHWRYVDKEKNLIEKLNTDYLGDFTAGTSFAYTVQFAIYNDAFPELDGYTPDGAYIRDYITDTTRVKRPALFDAEYRFNQQKLAEQIPTSADIKRMIDEEIVKFVMGARPMSEYDQFLEDLKKADIDNWIKVYTEEYNRVKSS